VNVAKLFGTCIFTATLEIPKYEEKKHAVEDVDNHDPTFKPASKLSKIYFEKCGVSPDKDTVVYCRIGERSSHTWFVLTYLLSLNNVRSGPFSRLLFFTR